MKHEGGLAFSDYKDLPVEYTSRENIRKNLIGQYYEKRSLVYPKNTKRAYHAFSRGWILNEIVRRVDDK